MEPVPPFWTSSSSPYYDTTSTRPSYDLGNATVHRNPINLVRNYEVDFRRDTISSSLFSSDLWFSSSASSRNCERRVIPYNKILPPLQLPTRDLTVGLDSSDDFWPKKCLNREKFSLPPIQMQLSSVSDVLDDKVSACESDSMKKYKRVVGVQKHKRKNRLSSVRRMLTCLMRRNTKGEFWLLSILHVLLAESGNESNSFPRVGIDTTTVVFTVRFLMYYCAIMAFCNFSILIRFQQVKKKSKNWSLQDIDKSKKRLRMSIYIDVVHVLYFICLFPIP